MSWFEAYMLWSSTAISVFLTLGGFILAAIGGACIGISNDTDCGHSDKSIKGIIVGAIILGVGLLTIPVGVLYPTTETMLKIIATKKGVDAIQSDTGTKYLNETDKAITNGLKVLNQEIEKKLEKKDAK